MYLDNLFGAGSYLSPYQWGTLPSANANSTNSANGANVSGTSPVISAKAPAPVSSANLNSDQVSLSAAAQALQTQSGTATEAQSGATTDFSQEQQMLTTLTDKSLAALGIISPADEANTQITFDALSYQVSSSATAAVGQQGSQSGAAVGASQDATFTGVGHIVTPDGTQYTFQVSLELDQSEQASSTADSGSGTSGVSNTAGSANSADGTDNTDNTTQPSNLLAQLVNAIGYSPSISSATGSSGAQSSSGDSLSGNAVGSTQSPSAGATSSSGEINWQAILKQTDNLFDLLDSLITPKSGSDQTTAQTANQTSASTSAATSTATPAATSTQVSEQTPVAA